MSTESETTTLNENDPHKGGSNMPIYILMVPFTLVMSWTVFVGMFDLWRSVDAWQELRQKSEAHNVLVRAYRGCRDKFISGSIEECHLVVKEYAELKGLESELTNVLNDIYSLTDKIRTDEL